jgi:hypothetical protein
MNKTKVFERSYLVDTLGLPDDEDCELVEIVLNELEDSGRWTLNYKLVFKLLEDNTFYQVSYSRGATENQWEAPWEYEETIKATIVEPKEVTVIDYVPVKEE